MDDDEEEDEDEYEDDDRWPLFDAIEYEGLDEIQEIVRNDPHLVQVKHDDGRLPLIKAILCSSPLPVVHFLLDAYPGALQDADDKGWVPLHYAAADDTEGQEHLVQRLLSVVRLLVERGPQALEAKDKNGRLPLHLAARYDLSPPAIVQFLMSAHPKALEIQDNHGMFPLHFAARYLDVEEVSCFVEGNREALRVKDHKGLLPLHHAAKLGARRRRDAVEVVRVLVDEYPRALQEKDDDGWLPLHHAASSGWVVRGVKWLTGKYPDALRMKANDGSCPIHVAALRGWTPMVTCLARKCPRSLMEKDNEGRVPLHVAAAHCDLAGVEYLVRKCPQSLCCKDEVGWSPCHVAASKNARPEVVLYLASASPNEVTDKEGWLALHGAAQYAKLDVVQRLAGALPETLEVPDKAGRHALHVAAQRATVEVIQDLVDRRPAALQAKTNDGLLALHVAALRGSIDVVQCIVNGNADALRERTNEGWLPCQLAALNDAPLDAIYSMARASPLSVVEMPVAVAAAPPDDAEPPRPADIGEGLMVTRLKHRLRNLQLEAEAGQSSSSLDGTVRTARECTYELLRLHQVEGASRELQSTKSPAFEAESQIDIVRQDLVEQARPSTAPTLAEFELLQRQLEDANRELQLTRERALGAESEVDRLRLELARAQALQSPPPTPVVRPSGLQDSTSVESLRAHVLSRDSSGGDIPRTQYLNLALAHLQNARNCLGHAGESTMRNNQPRDCTRGGDGS